MSLSTQAAGVPEGLQSAQEMLLAVLDRLGLAGQVDGQPAWPWAHRVAVETLVIDAGLTRQLVAAVVAVMLVGVLLSIAWRWRRARVLLVGLAVAVLFATPWPPASLLLQPAVPTSFHRAPSALPVARLDEGLRLYRSHCAQCHGDDGRGETALAATLPVWPPRLTGALLWRRAEGESYWHLRQGVRTMPAFASVLTPEQTWSLLGALRLLASGQSLKEQGRWAYPQAAPDLALRCADAPVKRLSEWRGRRVRIVIAGSEGVPREDPRFETVVLGAGGDCVVAEDAPQARALVALLAGRVSSVDGLQLLVDRDGWLRALGRPGEGGWRAEDLVCRSGGNSAAVPGEDVLDTLIRQIDADPVPVGPVFRHRG